MFQITTLHQKPWVSADVLAEALEYARPKNLIDVYRNNRDEFTENDVLEVFGENRAETGRPSKSTYFSEDGAILLCMLSRTEKAKEVRKLIREVFMNWYRGQKAARALPPQPELFPKPEAEHIPVELEAPIGTLRFSLPKAELLRLVQVQPTSVAPVKTAGAAIRPRHPHNPKLALFEGHDFEGATKGMHGWFTTGQIAKVVGCPRNTVLYRIRRSDLPEGWGTRKKDGRWLIFIP